MDKSAAQRPEARVNGVPVQDFRALIDGAAGALVTRERVAVFSRVYYVDGVFHFGDGQERQLAGETVTGCDYSPQEGLRLHTTNYECVVPAQFLKATWRRPA